MLDGMTKIFDKAIAEARKLPPEEQDAIGARILEEIADEALWAKKFAERPDVLEKLAEEALAEHRAGKTTPLEFPRRK
jgi:phage/plasmid-associated DNA primase